MIGSSRSTRPPRPCSARSGPLPAPASSITTTRELRSCADAVALKMQRTAMAQRAVREIHRGECAKCCSQASLDPSIGSAARPGSFIGPRAACGSFGAGGSRFASKLEGSATSSRGSGKRAGLPMTGNVQRILSSKLDHAAGAVRSRLAATRSRDFDSETGLRTRAHLHADLARLDGLPARLELLALQPEDGLDDALLSGVEADLPQQLGRALRAAVRAARGPRLPARPHPLRLPRPDRGRGPDRGPVGAARTRLLLRAARRRRRARRGPHPRRGARRDRRPRARPRAPARTLAPAAHLLRAPGPRRPAPDPLRAPLRRLGGRAAARRRPRDRRRPPPRPRAEPARRRRPSRRDAGHRHARGARGRAAQARDARARGVGDDPPPPRRRRAHPRRRPGHAAASRASCARATSASTAPAIPTGWWARRSPSARA